MMVTVMIMIMEINSTLTLHQNRGLHIFVFVFFVFLNGGTANLVSVFFKKFGSQTNLSMSLENMSFTMHSVQIPLALSGQKAEQRAKGISFHALPPQTQMFTPKTSLPVQIGP